VKIKTQTFDGWETLLRKRDTKGPQTRQDRKRKFKVKGREFHTKVAVFKQMENGKGGTVVRKETNDLGGKWEKNSSRLKTEGGKKRR